METKICKDCKMEKPISEFSPTSSRGRKTCRAECKECSRLRFKKRRVEDPYKATLKSLSEGILKRTTYAGSKSNIKNKCYYEKNIKCLLGGTSTEVAKMLDLNYGDDIKNLLNQHIKPSVDRIDSSGNYEIGNIRIIDLKENVALGLKNAQEIKSRPIRILYSNGEFKDMPSILLTAKFLECKRDVIYAHLDGSLTKQGLTFKYL